MSSLRGLKSSLVEGSYRARVVRFGPAGHAAKPCLAATFLILEPAAYAGRFAGTRLYYHDRALWKLRWFLRDFKYDAALLAADDLDDRRVVGLEGVISLAYWGQDGHRRLGVQGFAPGERWKAGPDPQSTGGSFTATAQPCAAEASSSEGGKHGSL